jgi:NADPH-dependent 2,4-dienoyl-CoA reductase/sulfur reductase-like enzyme
MTQPHLVIIGNGLAANSAADWLRQHDSAARITLISDEFFLCYHRHLLPRYIAGELSEEELIARPFRSYKERNIRLRLGQKVVKLWPQQQTLYLEHMEKVHYHKLLICSGGRPRIPEIYYRFHPSFTYLKTIMDAREIRKIFPEIRKVLIIGGDLVSLRMTELFLAHGKEVTFVLDDESLWPIALTADIKARVAENLRHKGATVWSDMPLIDVAPGRQSRYEVKLGDGSVVACDMIGAFFGLIPEIDFLIGTGLDLDRGIVVNEFLQSNFPDIFAAGDCAQVYHPQLKNYWISIGYPNARMLGSIAAQNMLGSAVAAQVSPPNTINFGSLQLPTACWEEAAEHQNILEDG